MRVIASIQVEEMDCLSVYISDVNPQHSCYSCMFSLFLLFVRFLLDGYSEAVLVVDRSSHSADSVCCLVESPPYIQGKALSRK